MSLFYEPIYKLRIGNINIITNENLNSDIKVQMDTNLEGDRFEVKIYNIGDIEDLFLKIGDPIEITLGYTSIDSLIITGVISNIYNDDDLANTGTVIEGIDKSIYDLKNTLVNLSINVPTDVIEIIRQISSQAGVILSLDTVPSGTTLPDYSVNNKFAYDEIKDLAKRIKYSVTAKKNRLFVTKNLLSSLVSIPIDDNTGLKLTPIETKLNDKDIKGYKFHGSGNPTLIPLSNAAVAIIEDGIFGSFIVESVEHIYMSDQGYISSGVLISADSEEQDINLIQKQTYKSIANTILKRIEEKINNIPTLQFGDIENLVTLDRLFTILVGFNPDNNQSIINRSIETTVGNNNVFLNNKPISTIFAGNGYGVIVPIYKDNRVILAHHNKETQDVNIIGCLWKKSDTIPEHDEGEFLIHMKEHSKISLKEDGHGIFEFKGLKIVIDTSLGTAKTTSTSDGNLVIEIDGTNIIEYDGSDLVLENGSKITINSSGVDVT